MPRAKKDTNPVLEVDLSKKSRKKEKILEETKIEDLEEFTKRLIYEYFQFVVAEMCKSDDLKEQTEYIKKHKITTRVIKTEDKHLFTIYKGKKLVDQNDMRFFVKREKKDTTITNN